MIIHGECMGVEIVERKERAPLFKLLVEDDGYWGESSGHADVYWLDDLISVLQQAKHYVEDNFERDPEGYFQSKVSKEGDDGPSGNVQS